MGDIVIQLRPQILVHILAAAIYAWLGFHFWNTRWREREGSSAATPMRAWERAAIGAVLVLHGAGLYALVLGNGAMQFSFSLALSSMLWLAVLIYWLESFRSRMDGLQPLVLPLAALCTLLPVVFRHTHVVAHADAVAFKFHFLAAMLAYSLFTLAALHAVFMGVAEAALHRRSVKRSLGSFPPLLTMEALLFHMLRVAFVVLTLTLASGALFSETIFGKAVPFDHKRIFAFLSWGIFAALLVGRHVWGWRGRKALYWTLAGFMSLLLAYVGSRFVLEVILGRV